jgi:hypothetical protein
MTSNRLIGNEKDSYPATAVIALPITEKKLGSGVGGGGGGSLGSALRAGGS